MHLSLKHAAVPRCGHEVLVTTCEGEPGLEIHVACGSAHHGASLEAQVRGCYEDLARVLADAGVTPSRVVSERFHVADADSGLPLIPPARREFYGSPTLPQPASSVIRQPPARPGQRVALQAQIVVPRAGARTRDVWHSSANGFGSARIREEGDFRWIHVGNCAGASHVDAGELPGTFEAQALEMFTMAGAILDRHGASFHDVARTWIFVKDIDRDYAGLNRARGAFFESHRLARLPASTGIQGHPLPSHLLCALDLVAVQGAPSLRMETMHARSLNEAPAYGVLFSRGMRVEAGGRTVLYISGTASIDDHGDVVHLGDRTNQTRRMFENIRNLLEAQGATMNDLVSLTSYLKAADFHDEFVSLCGQCGVPARVPNTVVHAGVCRPTWLVEVEGIAVIDGHGPR